MSAEPTRPPDLIGRASGAPMIVGREVTKRFGAFTAIDAIDFTVTRGETFGFLGPNGAGKSSTMKLIVAVSPITSGHLSILGMDPAADGPKIRARLGVVAQDDNLDTELTVYENLVIYGRYFGVPNGARLRAPSRGSRGTPRSDNHDSGEQRHHSRGAERSRRPGDRGHPPRCHPANRLSAVRATAKIAHMSAPRLEGQLTCLRPFVDADEPAFVSQATYPEMFEFMKFRYATRKEAADGFAWLMELEHEADPRGRVFWAIETADDHTFVGWAGIESGVPEHGDELGWYLLPPYWRRGFATEATAALLRYGFEALGSSRMIATCDPENVGSMRVLEKTGLVSEGLLRELVATWRGPRPRLMYATPSQVADQAGQP